MNNQQSNRLPWKAVFLGAVIGYLLAISSPSSISFHGQLQINPTSHRVLTTTEHAPKQLIPESFEVKSEDGEDEEEEEHEVGVLDTSITIIVMLLVVLTLFFEFVKEAIEESADRTMEPVIEGLFGELTVLGFLSMVTFCTTKAGAFHKLGVKLFGEEEEEELLEIFEHVHFMLFFIMAFFVVNVLVLMQGCKLTSHKWWIFNRACLDPEYMKKFDTLLASTPGTFADMNYFRYLLSKIFPNQCRNKKHQMRSELELFRGLRDEFIAERSLEPPFALESAHRVHDDFDFGAYLTICQARSVSHMVHLSHHTWIFLAIVTLVYYCIALAIDNDLMLFAWIWAGSGWIIFLCGNCFDFHMVQLLDKMVARHSYNVHMTNGEKTELLSDKDDRTALLPAWTKVDLEHYMQHERSLLKKILLRDCPKPSRQDVFYWWEVKGPKVYQVLFQIQMVWTASYVSLLCLILLPLMVIHSDQAISHRALYFAVSILPVYLLLSKYQVAAANLTMACSFGNHRKPAVISEVERDEKTKLVIWHLVTLLKLKQVSQGGFSIKAPQDAPVTHASSRDLQGATSIFKALDADGSGEIAATEIGELFIGLGAQLEKETLDAIVRALDTDRSGSISLEEFLEFYERYILVKLDHKALHELAKDMFAQLDVDRSGEVTLSEFKQIISRLDVGFSLDEIGALVKELDESDDGTISEHEFEHLLLEKHRRMFEHAPLPDLE